MRIELLLLGKSGSGKSSTGNSILGKQVFPVSSSTGLQGVSKLDKQTGDFVGRNLAVIDGLDIYKCVETSDFSDFEKALKLSGEGISAFLLVLKYGEKFGDHDRKFLDVTKSKFGTDVIRDYGICVLTFGDNFKHDLDAGQEGFKSVEEWFQQQSGSMLELFQECNKRCVLFNNKTKEEKEKDEQVLILLKLIINLNKVNSKKYKSENYKLAKTSELRKTVTERKCELQIQSQEYHSQRTGADCLQKTMLEQEEHPKYFRSDFETISEPFSTKTCESKSEVQTRNDKTETFKAGSSYSLELPNVQKTFTETFDSDSHPKDIVTSSGEEMFDMSKSPTSDIGKRKKSVLTAQNKQKYEAVDNQGENKEQVLINASDRVKTIVDEIDSGIDEMKVKIERKERELIDLYKETLTFLKNIDDTMQYKNLKKDVEEKMHFLEKQAEAYRGAKRLKLEEKSYESCERTPEQTSVSNEVTLLLVGSAGNGKSATGNSILERQVFKTTASTSSQSSETQMESGSMKEVKVNVVDGPGIDTDKSPEVILQTSIQTLEKALKICDYKFSALLIVLKYGARFTKQESDFIKTTKGILGKNVIRDFGVCIITHGDNFEADNEDENLAFQEWCQQQDGQIKELFEECNYKCVLFNNRTKDQNLKELQINQLLEVISKDKSYSKKDFTAAFKDMQKLIIETNAPKIFEETKTFISKTRKRMAEIVAGADTDIQMMTYKEMLDNVNAFEQELLDKYGDPNNIKQSHLEIKLFRMEINNKLKTCVPIKDTEKNVKKTFDRVHTSSKTPEHHPLEKNESEEEGFVIVGEASSTMSHGTTFSPVDRYAAKKSFRDRKTFSDSGAEGQSISTQYQLRGVREGSERIESRRIEKIYQRIQTYKHLIENLNSSNAQREQWKIVRAEFDKEVQSIYTEMFYWSKDDRYYLDEQILVINGLFSTHMPKSEKSLWKMFTSFLSSKLLAK